MVTMSEREGLFGPAFYALSVRNVRVVFVVGTTIGGVAPTVVSVSPGGERGTALCVGFSEEGTLFGSTSFRGVIPESVGAYPSGVDRRFSGCGDPRGE